MKLSGSGKKLSEKNSAPNTPVPGYYYLKNQLKIITPKLIVALGKVAAQTLLRIDIPLAKMREHTYL